MKTLTVLMWKHLVVRKRKFIHTSADFFAPLAFFLLIFLLKGYISPEPKSAKSEEFTIQNTEPVDITNLQGPTAIFYTPDTELAGLLMDNVGESFMLPQKTFTPGALENYGYMPFTDINDILKSNRKLVDTDAIVTFQNLNNTWPKQLKYTISMRGDFRTDRVTADDGSVGPHESFGTIYEPFIRLQWAIDSNFLKLVSGSEIKQKVSIQEFPYVRQAEAPVVKIVCYLMPFICWVSLLLTFVFLTSKLLEERVTGIQELIKMVGVSNLQLILSHFLNMLPVGLIFSIGGTILLKITSHPVIPSTNPLIIMIFLALHFLYVVSMAYCFSYVLTTTQYVVSVTTLAYVVLTIPMQMVGNSPPSWTLPLVGLLPFAPTQWFWEEIGQMESYGKGASFGTIMKTHTDTSGSILASYALMLLQSALFLTLGCYLSLVNPGPFAQGLPWNFLCSPNYWSRKQVMPEEEEAEELTEFQDPQYFEPSPKNMEAGIRIVNVSKTFSKNRALTDVTLDVYRGDITVLLGHNGAGKTTLMSIITGMLNATEGKVYVEGYDTATQKGEMRKLLGLCPQHNLFFSDLNILEHVIFFTLLKGCSYPQALESSECLLRQLGLGEKGAARSSELSGGMKRRLQLACALAGDARVLVLDEPTSGLDVETRRELWDLLLSLRGSRTVLLSTHFMEEADALGDRVAALHAGRLVCNATTMHLKRAIGTGYRLSFVTDGRPKESAITALITSVVPEATVKEQSLNSISYNLPSASTSNFPKLFNRLESKRIELGIASIGVGISTLEEVFLKLCSDTTTTFADDDADIGTSEPTYTRYTGMKLYWRQFAALFCRQMKYFYSNKISFLLINVIIPITMLCVITLVSNESMDPEPETGSVGLDLDLYGRSPGLRRVMLNVTAPGADLRALSDAYPKVDFEITDDVADAILRTGKRDVFEYNKYLIGIELNETHAKALYSTLLRHAAPVSVSVLSNLVATRLVGGAGGRALQASNRPLRPEPAPRLLEPKSTTTCYVWILATCLVVLSASTNYKSLPSVERAAGTRHLHVLSGCAPALHWAAALAAHAACAAGLLALPAALAALLDAQRTLDDPAFMAAMFVLVMTALLAFLAFSYFISLFFGDNAGSVVLVISIVLFGFFTPTIKTAKETFSDEVESIWDSALALVSACMPPHALVRGGFKAVHCAHVNALCVLNRANSCLQGQRLLGMDLQKCCVEKINPRCFFCFDRYSPMAEVLYLLFQFVFYMTLVYLCEMGVVARLLERTINSYKPGPELPQPELVAAEKLYVDKAIALPKRDIPDALLVNDVHKKYFAFRKPCVAVKGVSFSVKKGECFGLLGVNGAGKTSTFKMLAGLECISKGSIYANGHFMNPGSTKYLQSLGYCPQFFGLDGFLSGRDNLALLLTLHGLNERDVDKEVDTWIRIVGLERYAARALSTYSGGCARRLAAAGALCTAAPTALLDEPTAGVDVAARRRVWAALRRAAPTRAIVITSHSMDEMEALCSRIGILVSGRLRALGAAAELRAQHAAGHAARLKLAPPDTHARAADETDSTASDVSRLKATMQEKFDCTLRDEHKTMLHYHINDTMRYSRLFAELEQLKRRFPDLLEDYDITETTLEEVFLALAREQDGEGDRAADV